MVGRVIARSIAFDSAEEVSWLEGLWFDRTGVPEFVRIGSLSCVCVLLLPMVGSLFVQAPSQYRARS